jgi:hypothetical protein
MKKYILALFFIISIANFSFGQPDGPPVFCDDCDVYGPGQPLADPVQYDNCRAENCPTLPIDSNILFLFALAVSFGSYSVYKGKLGVAIKE